MLKLLISYEEEGRPQALFSVVVLIEFSWNMFYLLSFSCSIRHNSYVGLKKYIFRPRSVYKDEFTVESR